MDRRPVEIVDRRDEHGQDDHRGIQQGRKGAVRHLKDAREDSASNDDPKWRANLHESIGTLHRGCQHFFCRGIVKVVKTQVENPALLGPGPRQHSWLGRVDRFVDIRDMLTALDDFLPGLDIRPEVGEDKGDGLVATGSQPSVHRTLQQRRRTAGTGTGVDEGELTRMLQTAECSK